MNIESIPICDLKLDPDNAREHPKGNLKSIERSLKRFGQQKPILVSSDNVVIAGNGTVIAAKSLGLAAIWVTRSELTHKNWRAYAIADNRTAELAAWNKTILGKTLNDLHSDGIDLADIGFEGFKVDTPVQPGCDDDDVPENVEPKTKPGDLYILGNHRLLCGDSTNVQHVERLMAGEKAEMVFADPPYGVNERTMRKSAGRSKLAESHDFQPVIGDDSNQTATDAFGICQALAIPTQIFWGANYYCHSLPETSSWVVWDKRDGVGSDDNADCELAWCNNRKPTRVFRHLWRGCIRASEKGESKVHPTQKPVVLAEWCFENYGNPKSVLDLFLGSGSTLIACEKTGRRCFGMEIDTHYCDVIVSRWEKFSGGKAVLEASHGES